MKAPSPKSEVYPFPQLPALQPLAPSNVAMFDERFLSVEGMDELDPMGERLKGRKRRGTPRWNRIWDLLCDLPSGEFENRDVPVCGSDDGRELKWLSSLPPWLRIAATAQMKRCFMRYIEVIEM
jgi:hypothetical protein